MPRALLVIGGDTPPYTFMSGKLAQFDAFAAADSGLDVLKAWGLHPILVAGDMDSIADPALLLEYKTTETVIVPEAKDETDTELCIRLLHDRGFDEIVLAGGGGGRLDHILALRALFERESKPIEWITSRERVVCIERASRFKVECGALVSVFPLSLGGRGMSSSGLQWSLDGLQWGPGDFGISNKAVEGEIYIDPGDFPLLVVFPLM